MFIYSIILLLCLEYIVSVLLSYSNFFFKQNTAYEMRISDWSSDVCSSDLRHEEWGIVTGKRRRATTPVRPNAYFPIKVPAPRRVKISSSKIGRASCRERVCQYV